MNDKNLIPVWDIFVRVFHWSLVLAFTIAYLTEDDFEDLHVYAGYVVLGLICYRVIWGFIGSSYARFSNFVYPISEVKSYLSSLLTRNPKHYLGHNPAGGMMIIALLVSLFAATISGLKIYGVQGYGPLANNGIDISIISEARAHGENKHEDDEEKEESEEEEFWEEIHEFFANFTLLLVFVHIAGVFVSSRIHGENLVRAMITGKKEEK
ncbi:MAG: cytochrome b/b6 domain-containing protein [Gammaproteobacteria bacterium]|nr:cytochrome b/b6 domain-containing protein [Gammaproteobacteria bacterium]MCK5263042.1 cytochrome b/b6 domain-containing protein [Gammaproteobacteria bacterium]